MSASHADYPSPPEPPTRKRPVLVGILQVLISLIVLGGGAALGVYYMKTGPKPKPRTPQPSPTFVEVTPLHYQSYRMRINTMGTVVPAKEIVLTAGVGGEVIKVAEAFVPGGLFTAGEQLLELDPIEYRLTISQLNSQLAIANSELSTEMGNQRIAEKEFALLNQQVSKEERELILRVPQLATGKANLESARAKLAQAERDLAHTRVIAPFNGVVRERQVNRGSRVTATTSLANLAGTDCFWVKLLVPVSELHWLQFPDDTTSKDEVSEVVIHLQDDRNSDASSSPTSLRKGRLFRLSPDLEEQGRMAVVYVAVDDPLCLKEENRNKARLLLGSYVRAEILGTTLSPVIALNRNYLRDQSSVWLMNSNNQLEIRPVTPLARSEDSVLIAEGLNEGELLITSNLTAPVAGTAVRLFSEASGPGKSQDKNQQKQQGGKPLSRPDAPPKEARQ